MTDIEEYEEEDYESDLKKELLAKKEEPKQLNEHKFVIPVPNLKPCPFCGGDVELRTKIDMGDETAFIHCTNCHMWFEKFVWRGVGYQTIIQEWNRRVNE